MELVTIIRNTRRDNLVGMVTSPVVNKCDYQNRGKLHGAEFLAQTTSDPHTSSKK
jgi:hypothetical protein